MLRFIVVLCLMLVPTIAFAQATEPEQPAAVEILDWLVMMAAIVALGAAGWVARRAAGWVKVKTGLETEVLLLSLTESAVSLAEERAHRAAKVAGQKLSSSEKLDVALDFARDRAKDMGLDKKAEAKLRQYVDAKLGATR
jgi:Bacteriophage holin of superfamily 6 (Holin_LLH)